MIKVKQHRVWLIATCIASILILTESVMTLSDVAGEKAPKVINFAADNRHQSDSTLAHDFPEDRKYNNHEIRQASPQQENNEQITSWSVNGPSNRNLTNLKDPELTFSRGVLAHDSAEISQLSSLNHLKDILEKQLHELTD